MGQYKVVKNRKLDDLEKKVDELISKGYVPQGGLSVVQGSQDRWNGFEIDSKNSGTPRVAQTFIQAMYKPKEEEKRKKTI
mgnify:CR=1 FL=1